MIGLIDYGLGNLKSFSNILKRLNSEFLILNDKRDFGLETLEELLDAIVYLTIKILQIRNKLNDKKRD